MVVALVLSRKGASPAFRVGDRHCASRPRDEARHTGRFMDLHGAQQRDGPEHDDAYGRHRRSNRQTPAGS